MPAQVHGAAAWPRSVSRAATPSHIRAFEARPWTSRKAGASADAVAGKPAERRARTCQRPGRHRGRPGRASSACPDHTGADRRLRRQTHRPEESHDPQRHVAFGELQPSLVADPALAADGETRVAWARAHMPVLGRLRAAMERDRPLEGRRIGMCLHVEAKTAVLVETLLAGGAEIAWTGSPATTDDGVAAAMTAPGQPPDLRPQGRRHRRPTTPTSGASSRPDPDMLLDNGADLIAGTIEAPPRGCSPRPRRRPLAGCASPESWRAGSRSRSSSSTTRRSSSRSRASAGSGPRRSTASSGRPTRSSRARRSRSSGSAGAGGASRGRCGRWAAVVIVVEIDPVRALEAAYEGMLVTTIERPRSAPTRSSP